MASSGNPFLEYLAVAWDGGQQLLFSPQVEPARTYCINTQQARFIPASAGTNQGAGDRGRCGQEALHNATADSLLKASVMDGSIVWGWGMASTAGTGLACCILWQAGRTLPALTKPCKPLLPITCGSVLVLAGVELIFFIVAGMGLCFGFVLETVLIIQECFRYC